MATGEEIAKASPADLSASSWVAALSKLREWDPAWAELAVKITTDPSTNGILPKKFVELVSVGLNATRTGLNPEGTRRHIRAALAAGATRQEVLFVLKTASVMSIHSGSFNAPLLVKEASVGSMDSFAATRKRRLDKIGQATPGVERMKALGHWNEEWDSLLFLDPVWTDQYMAMCGALYAENVLPPKQLELLLVAFDAAYVHIYGPGTRHHIKNAFKAGATIDEIMEVLKLGVVQGVQACGLGVTILAEELERNATSQRAGA
ncbi:MAG TPA: carboxymuconolactone decarboxylase family protein [Candidatus Acidoferrum sp.]|nr:carboxymuconolactone decarboxylase family protein [Candidatus Acidoferrum sp.]